MNNTSHKILLFLIGIFLYSCSNTNKIIKINKIEIEVLENKKLSNTSYYLKIGSKSMFEGNQAFFKTLKKVFYIEAEKLCLPYIYDNTTKLSFNFEIENSNIAYNFIKWYYLDGKVNCLKDYWNNLKQTRIA